MLKKRKKYQANPEDVGNNNGFTVEELMYVQGIGERISRVLLYIHTHLDEPLSVERLAEEACLSTYHFHRLFSHWCGMGLAAYVRQLRIFKAANMLLFRQHQQILSIALDSGFNSAEAFTRAFKSVTGQTPSAFKNNTDWQVLYCLSNQLANAEEPYMSNTEYTVDLVELASLPVAIWLHQGPPQLLGKSIQSFIQWRKENRLSPQSYRTFNFVYDDPATTSPEEYRFGLVSEVSGQVTEDAPQVTRGTLPGGLCAHIRHRGPDHLLEAKVAYLYSTWIHSQPYELRDAPMVMERVSFYPDVPATEATTDIFLPVSA